MSYGLGYDMTRRRKRKNKGNSFLLSTFIGAQLTDSSLETMAASLPRGIKVGVTCLQISLFRFGIKSGTSGMCERFLSAIFYGVWVT